MPHPIFARLEQCHKKIDEELSRLVKEGILEPADWATPIVAVLRSDKKSVRICGDFRMTINPVSKLDKSPIPKIEDIFAKLKGGKTFTKRTSAKRTSSCFWMQNQKKL